MKYPAIVMKTNKFFPTLYVFSMSMSSKNEKVLKLSTIGNSYFGCNKLKMIIGLKANHIKGGG